MEEIEVWQVIVDQSAYGMGGTWHYFRSGAAAEKLHLSQHPMGSSSMRSVDAVEIDGKVYFKPIEVEFSD